MKQNASFTQGSIARPLIRFTFPVLFAMCLQSLHGAVDLLVVGRFGTAADVSAVSTGSQMMQMITVVITGLAMGTTILLGHAMGSQDKRSAGKIVGSSMVFFVLLAVGMTALMLCIAHPFVRLMHAPEEAFQKTVWYVQICSCGILFIAAYNVLGSIFRGLGDSGTPLLTVLCACLFNIAGDLYFVAVLQMQAAGAALATILAQAFSVLLCIVVIRKKRMAFPLTRQDIRLDKKIVGRILKVGLPVALQDGLVNISFLVIHAIVNGLGVIASAGVGVAEKVCAFIMLVPSSFSQSLSAFVAQNIGAGQKERARRSMLYGMAASLAIGMVMAYAAFFHGGLLAGLFSKQDEVILAAADYLKAYAIDTLIVSFLFCYIGYFNGCGSTGFVMVQGIAGAFLVRIPVSYFVSKTAGATLFTIGLATPASTVVQIVLCTLFYSYVRQKEKGDL